jgi:carboxylesterase type B
MDVVKFLIACSLLLLDQAAAQSSSCAPSVTLKNGTYSGVFQPSYGQDFFLGVPFAQAPVGDLRFAVPQPLNSSWQGSRNATAYYPECVGYGVRSGPKSKAQDLRLTG